MRKSIKLARTVLIQIPGLYAQLHTKAITVSKISECVSSGIEGVALKRIKFFPYIFTKKKSNKGA